MIRSIEENESLTDLPARFISFEGTEGMGKSTHIQYLVDFLRSENQQVIITREPGGTPMAEDLRGILLKQYAEKTLSDTEMLLLYAGRVQHIKHTIIPALKAGKWVISDRFFDSTFAYQGGGRGTDLKRVQALNDWALGDFAPNKTFVLDAPVEVGLQRIQARDELDRFEKQKIEFFSGVREVYLQLAQNNPQRFTVIDASKPLAEVQERLKNQMLILLK